MEQEVKQRITECLVEAMYLLRLESEKILDVESNQRDIRQVMKAHHYMDIHDLCKKPLESVKKLETHGT